MARIEVPMPQMGESIAEGTVSRWMKAIGDSVERDEPILEISTDKVDAEIPSPSSGVLVAIEVPEGETVEVGTILAYIETDAAAAASASDGSMSASTPPASAPPASTPSASAPPAPTPSAQTPTASAPDPSAIVETPAETVEQGEGATSRAADESLSPEAVSAASSASPGEGGVDEPSSPGQADAAEVATAEERIRSRSTPVVRRIAGEHGIDISEIDGSGFGGRVTKQDVLAHLESRDAAPVSAGAVPPADIPQPPAATSTSPPRPAAPASDAAAANASAPVEVGFGWTEFLTTVRHPEFLVRSEDVVEPMDKIRRLTAEHMVLAKRIAAHVHSFIEVDFSRIDRVRRESRERWTEQGARVSYTAFVTWATSRVLREFPVVNSVLSGNNVITRGRVNVGIAVDLDPGLIVPVIRDTDHLSLVGIGMKIVDLAERARSRQLAPDEIQGATFSITNPGVLGTTVGMPIIPKGTSAILGLGAIEKRVVVVADADSGEDSIAIRKRSFFSMAYDHRLVDGADAARFLARLKEVLEDFPEDA